MQVFGFFAPAFLLFQCDGFYPWKIIPPAACQTIDIVSFVADNLCALGILRNFFISPHFSFSVSNQKVFQCIFVFFQQGSIYHYFMITSIFCLIMYPYRIQRNFV